MYFILSHLELRRCQSSVQAKQKDARLWENKGLKCVLKKVLPKECICSANLLPEKDQSSLVNGRDELKGLVGRVQLILCTNPFILQCQTS